MVKKIISCGDIHIPSLRGIPELEETLSKFCDDCQAIVDKDGRDAVRIVVAGDIFHNKISVTNESIISAGKFFKRLGEICPTIVLAGNHDMLMNNRDRVDSISPLFEIGGYPGVTFIDKELGYKSGCLEDDNVVWCLYSSFDGFATPQISAEKVSKPDSVYVGLIHADVNGAVTPTGFSTENGLDPAVFKDCTFVIAGHIHKQQEIRKNGVSVVYCSSIRQRDFGESITGHGYVIWNIAKKKPSYEFHDIPNENGGFFKFSINGIDSIKDDEEELINL